MALLLAMTLLELTGCSSRMSRAPVEDRNDGKMGVQSPANAIDSKPLPSLSGASNAGKPGYYTIKPGDTIMQVGRSTGQNWRDIVRWNNLESPNQIEVGQVLRVAPPESTVGIAVPSPVSSGSSAVTTTKPPPVVAVPAAPIASPTPTIAPEDDIAWIWPSNGALIAGFDEVKNKGLKIAGKLGDPVVASADGRVVYAGSGLRGYGNLVILKHNETYLTAYAHNQTLLVKEDQMVKKGQRIADMGSSDADRVMLHFEVRRQGKPVDPAKYLPVR
ncbi:MAG: peptidoglycan DD-metalloendopeptidase family protein [Actinomycetota bacterium]|nr:peptidoglycan DD-metalloendopeptidase family protein [Actinomycetota bacterium]